MAGKGPYRIYDPGGGTQEEAAAAFERLVEENTRLREKMQGIKSLGELLEESQLEASRLRQKVESLVKDNEMLRSTSSLDKLAERAGNGFSARFPASWVGRCRGLACFSLAGMGMPEIGCRFPGIVEILDWGSACRSFGMT
ncbi:UNVERIFIED_CONTAM: TNFAIP3-interacting protein 1 [Gekko kuhli]